MRKMLSGLLVAALSTTSAPAWAGGESDARKDQRRGEAQIPVCTKNLGTVAIVEPDRQWWREINLGSPRPF